MNNQSMPKFIPDDQASTFFGDTGSTSTMPSFIPDAEMETLSRPKTKTFDVPDIETPEQKIARYNAEQVVYDKKAKEDNSVTGFLKNFGKALVGNVASSEVGLGNTIAKTFGNQSEDVSNQIQDTTTTQYNLLKLIRQKEMKGKDTTKLKQLYNDADKQLKEQQARLGEETDLPTTGQAVGQLGGTTLDLLTAGTYGKVTQGMKGFQLAEKASPTATKLVTEKATGLFSKEGAKKVAKGTGIGYGFDVAQNLQEGDTGADILKPGFGSVLGGTFTALPQIGKTVTPDSTKIMQRVGRITPSQQVKFEKMAGENVGEYLSSRQIFGNEEQIVKKLYDRFVKSKEAGDLAIESLPGEYQFKPVKTMIKDLVERESKVSTEGALSPDFNRINELEKKYKSTGLTMQENNEVKRLFERNVKLNYIKENLPEKVDRANNIDSAVREMMFEKADELGLKNLRQIQKETQLARTLADQIGKYSQGRQANNALSLTDAVLLAGGDPESISMFLTRKIFSSKRIQSWVAKVARDKGKDVGEIEALFGEAQPLPKRLEAGLNIPLKDTSGIDKAGTEAMNAKYAQQAQDNTLKLPSGNPDRVQGETVGLPSRTATGVDMNESMNAKIDRQSQLGSKVESYGQSTIKEPKSTVVRDAQVISDITSDLPKDDKQGLMEVLKVNRPQVYKEVIETENAERRSMFDSFKGAPMSEKMNAKEINKAVNLHIGNAFQVLNDPDTAKLIDENPQAFIKQTFDNIVMGLEKDAPSASKKIAKIDIEGINSISQLGNAIEKSLNKGEGFVDKIINKIKDTPNKQGGFISTGNKESTVAVHNISADKLKKANNVGGFVNPSMAIFDSNHGFDDYGEISLIANKNLISQGKTYASDVYSPRYPKVYQEVSTIKPIEADLKKYESLTGDKVYSIDKENISRSLDENGNTMASFLDSKGIDIPTVKDGDSVSQHKTYYAMRNILKENKMTNEYEKYVESLLGKLNVQEKLYAGTTPSGKAKMIPNSAENASRLMNKQGVTGAEKGIFGAGLPNIRAKASPQLKTLSAIKGSKDKLVTREVLDESIKKYETELDDLLKELDDYAVDRKGENPFTVDNDKREALADYIGGDKKAFSYSFKNIPESVLRKVDTFKKSLASMPTEYFETKFKRPVQVPEFKHAVVPDDIDPDTLKVLESNGIEVVRYKSGDLADRQRIIRELKDGGKIDTFGKVKVGPLTVGAAAGVGIVGANKAMTKDKTEEPVVVEKTQPIKAPKEMPAKLDIPDLSNDNKVHSVNLSPKKGSFVPKDWLKVMVAQESSNGTDKTNAKGDAGKYGYLVGFTKGTLADIKEQAKTSQRYKNLLAKLSFDTPQEAIDSAEAYAHHLMRDFGSKGEKDGTTPKDIDAVELYKAYNGGGSPAGVKLFASKLKNVNKTAEKK